MIGMDNKKVYTRHGRKFYKPYRNYFSAAPDWIKTAAECGMLFYHSLAFDEKPVLMADTELGTQFICAGDYIIKGTENSVYVCKKDIFEKISNPIDERPICKATGIRCSNCRPVCEHRSEK